jgi:hypothetical protein
MKITRIGDTNTKRMATGSLRRAETDRRDEYRSNENHDN